MFVDFITNVLGSPPEVLASPDMVLYVMGFVILIYIFKAFFSLFYLIAGIFSGYHDD